MENLYVDKPIYPILSLVSSTFIFIVGLIVANKITIVYYLIALTFVYLVFGYGKVLFKIIPVFFLLGILTGTGAMVTSGSYLKGIQTAGRILLLAYSSVIMVALPPIYLTRNLIQLRFPRILTLGMLATIRFIPMLMDESRQIREAMKTRGVNGKWYHLSVTYRAFLIPFIMRLISISDMMALSMETRGFVVTDHSATVYKRVEFHMTDGIFALLIGGIMIGAILL